MNDAQRPYSPIHNVEKIKIPILLAHGELDRSVPYSHSDRMASKLKSEGKVYEFLKLKDGDHFLSREANRLAFFRALDAFLAKHLGPAPSRQQSRNRRGGGLDHGWKQGISLVGALFLLSLVFAHSRRQRGT